MGLDNFDKFNEKASGFERLVKDTEKDLIKNIIKEVKKLKSTDEQQSFDDAKKQILEILKNLK